MIKKYFKLEGGDFKAAFVVFLVALPLCLGIALASGAPVRAGLIAGIVGGIVVGLLSPSQVSVSGPAAGLTIIVFAAIKDLGFETFCFAVTLSGLLQILFGYLRFGKLVNLIPVSVIKGMLAAIGIIIILKQIPHFFGFDVDQIGDFEFFQQDGENTFSEIIRASEHIEKGALLIGVFSVFIMLLWDFLSKKNKILGAVPSALFAVASGIFINEFINPGMGIKLGSEHLVNVPGLSDLFQFFNPLNGFKIDAKTVLVTLTLAVVGSIESLLSIEASEKIDPEKRSVDADKELKAQGIGNFLSGILGGLPLTAVIVRTSANIGSGGKTRWSCIFHGLLLGICIISVPDLLNKIPLSCLATILIFVGFKLTSPKLYKQYLRKGKAQYVPFLVTIFAILFTDLLIGVGIGLLVGTFFVIKRNTHESILMVNDENKHLIRFNKDASFLNKPLLKKLLKEVNPGSTVVLDGSRSVYIDQDIIDMLEDFTEYAPTKNIKVELKKSPLALSSYFRS